VSQREFFVACCSLLLLYGLARFPRQMGRALGLMIGALVLPLLPKAASPKPGKRV
jgi:hypothetical protein